MSEPTAGANVPISEYERYKAAPTADELSRRIASLLTACAETIRPCRACGEMLYFMSTKNGEQSPYTAVGLSHFACAVQRRLAISEPTSVPSAPKLDISELRNRFLQLLELGVSGTDYDRGHKRGIMAAIETLDQWQAGVTW